MSDKKKSELYIQSMCCITGKELLYFIFVCLKYILKEIIEPIVQEKYFKKEKR